jgi:hypothetical protein
MKYVRLEKGTGYLCLYECRRELVLFSAELMPDLALVVLLPGIPVKHLQTLFRADKLANGWFKHSEAMLDFMVDTVRLILEVFEEHPPTEFLAELDDLLKGNGIRR